MGRPEEGDKAGGRQAGGRQGGGRQGGGRQAGGRQGGGRQGGGRQAGRSQPRGDRRGKEAGEQPFRPTPPAKSRRPPLPEERPRLPRDAYRDLKATVADKAFDDVVKAVGAARDALASSNTARAVQLLTWAKGVAPRTATIRETLGIAHYLAGDYAAAHSELLAYRRLSARHDQNHLLADCARALGRHDRVAEYVEQMEAAGVARDRVAEGVIVLAGDRADRGDLRGGLRALQRVGLQPARIESWQPRVWYAAADLCQRLGDVEQAREYFEAILAVNDEFGDVEHRLATLE